MIVRNVFEFNKKLNFILLLFPLIVFIKTVDANSRQENKNGFEQGFSKKSIPQSLVNKNFPPVPVTYLKSINVQDLMEEDENRKQQGLPHRFAIPVYPKQSQILSGTWHSVGENAIWRLSISSAQASSFNFMMSHLRLPESARLYFYDKNYERVLGPFVKKDISSDGKFWSPLIESSEVVIELNISVADKPLLNFEVAQINLGYRDWQTGDLLEDECHIDVACSQGNDWRDPIRSVARYTIKGQFLCTGTLVNNTANDRSPYFLTAQHCEVTRSSAASMVFYWNYEKSSCGGLRDGGLNQFQSGAAFRASSINSDFALVELNQVPPSLFNVHWSGWDRRNFVPDNVASIHHPGGFEKSISFDFGPLTTTQRFSASTNVSGAYLRVNSWDEGSTAPGSSGAGIWNSQKQLVGTLTGGFASCAEPLKSDWYGRMSAHWNTNSETTAQVKNWLDAKTTDDLTLDGVDECTPPQVSVSVEPQNIQLNESASFMVSNGNGDYSYYWDFNDDGKIDSTAVNPQYTFDYLYQGNLRLKVTDTAGCTQTLTRLISVTPGDDELFPLAGRLSSRWSQPRGADASWSLDSSVFFEGGLSLKSNRILNTETASIELIHNFNHPTENFISFAVRTSTETGKDKLNFYVDNRLVDSWDGEVSWQFVYYPMTEGLHILRWSYEKDGQNSAGADAAWVDGVSGLEQSTSGGSGTSSIYQLILLTGLLLINRKRNKNQR